VLATLYAVFGTLLGALVAALISVGCENLDPGTGHYWVCEVLNDYGGIALLTGGPALVILWSASRARRRRSTGPLHRTAAAVIFGLAVLGVGLPALAVMLWPS
jgi:hypothetical protein